MPQAIPIQEAAAEIVRLINASPRSPRQEEIEAILAKAVPIRHRAGHAAADENPKDRRAPRRGFRRAGEGEARRSR
jgi:hypothetical protein